MRVLILTHYFPPEVGAPQVRLSALADALQRHGHRVTVHTTFPHYPEGRIAPEYRGRRLCRERRPSGVEVVRTPVYATPNKGFARRLGNHASFAFGAVATSAGTGPQDVVIVESPPLFTAAAGVAYAAVKRAPLIVNVADRWPASAVELGALRGARAVAAAEALERWCYRHAAVITVPTRGLRAALAEVDGARGKVRHIPPTVALDRFRGDAPAAGGPLKVLYAGTVGMAQGVATLVEAAALAGPDVVELLIAGGGAESADVEAAVARTAAPNVRLLGIVDAAQVPDLYAEADVGAVLLRDRPLFRSALPTKLFEVMAARRPVVLACRGEAATLVSSADAGVVVAPDDPSALAAAFRSLAERPGELARLGENGRRFVTAHHDRARLVEHWVDAIDTAAAASS